MFRDFRILWTRSSFQRSQTDGCTARRGTVRIYSPRFPLSSKQRRSVSVIYWLVTKSPDTVRITHTCHRCRWACSSSVEARSWSILERIYYYVGPCTHAHSRATCSFQTCFGTFCSKTWRMCWDWIWLRSTFNADLLIFGQVITDCAVCLQWDRQGASEIFIRILPPIKSVDVGGSEGATIYGNKNLSPT